MFSFTRFLGSGLLAETFCKALENRGIDSYFGVPGRQFVGLSAFAKKNVKNHIVTSNEGSALCMAAGYYMGTGSIPCVYLSNTGMGNILNPLLSVTHRSADSIPALVLIDWRGAPGTDDFPQHENIGRHTENLLAVLGQPFSILSPSDSPDSTLELILDKAFAHFAQVRSPYVVLTESDAFEVEKPKLLNTSNGLMSRREAVDHVLQLIPEDDILVTSWCGVSKDAVAARIKAQVRRRRDHISIGAREHAASIAEGIALATPSKNVFFIDYGFQSFLENFTTSPPKNLKRVVLRSPEHASTLLVAGAGGYANIGSAKTVDEIKCGMEKMRLCKPSVFEIFVSVDGQGEEVIKYNAKTIISLLQEDKESKQQ